VHFFVFLKRLLRLDIFLSAGHTSYTTFGRILIRREQTILIVNKECVGLLDNGVGLCAIANLLGLLLGVLDESASRSRALRLLSGRLLSLLLLGRGRLLE